MSLIEKFITSFSHNSDSELVDLLREGNRHAFEEIYERYWSSLYAYIYNRLRTRPVAEEIVQDVFLTLWIKSNNLGTIRSLSAYLFTGAKYRMLNEIKAGEVRANFASSFSNFQANQYSDITQETVAMEELKLVYEGAVNELPPKCRQIFQLSRTEHLSVAEISQQLNISHKTVENQLTKALKYLRFGLKEFLPLLGLVNVFN